MLPEHSNDKAELDSFVSVAVETLTDGALNAVARDGWRKDNADVQKRMCCGAYTILIIFFFVTTRKCSFFRVVSR
jgi:hypothetical protein